MIDFPSMAHICKWRRVKFPGGQKTMTCEKPDRIPPGASWGICSQEFCPYYGMEGKRVKIYDNSSGELIATMENIRFVLDQET